MEITREQLIEKLQHIISVASGFPESEKAQMDLELARIALASLEAEPVCYLTWHQGFRAPDDCEEYVVEAKSGDKSCDGSPAFPVYAAPPAPANAEPVAWLWSHRKHSSEVTLVCPEDDERAEGAHWSGWSCQALYAAPPAPVSVPDYPEVLPCPVMLEPGLRFGKGVNTRTMLGALQRRAEYHAELEAMTPEQRAEHDAGMKEFAAMLQDADGNSPVIPDGWVLVPEEPTHEMLEAGDEQFGTYDVYRRMIAASPQQEVKP